MRHTLLKLTLAVLALAATLAPVCATEITEFKITDQPKKIKLSFDISEEFEYSTVSDFNSNILVLNVEGLALSKKQKAKDHRLKGDLQYKVLRFVRFQNSGEQAQIRIYLGWEVNPADAQVISFDDRIEVDILKPMSLATEGSSAAGGEWEIKRDPTDADTGADEPQPEDVPETENDVEADGLSLGSLRQPDWPEQNPDTEPAGTESEFDFPDEDASADGGTDANADPSTDFRPAREFNSTPSYKKFDLDEVAVNQLEFRGIPFNLALLDLVAGTGFNVAIGDEIDNRAVTLNFTKKEMSLKGALYILCTAYDLVYTVEDDAIIIRAK